MLDKKVMVLMSTYNGQKYLIQQLESLYRQTYSNISVLVRDDGSTDDTIKILRSWEEKTNGWLKLIIGDNVGPCKSFWELLNRAEDADYYAFCDQDDYWEEDKIEKAVMKLESINETNCLYTSNVKFTDAELKVTGISNFSDNSSLGRFMIYNQAVGCTMVISRQLRKMIVDKQNIDIQKLKMHDCWIYRVCVATGGRVCFDKEAHILYRQHGNNVGGGSSNVLKIWKTRMKDISKDKRNKRQKMAIELMRLYDNEMSEEIKEYVKMVAEYNTSLKTKINFLKCKDVYSNKFIPDTIIRIAIIFNIV